MFSKAGGTMADNGDGFFKAFVLGGIIGGVLGVLFAPKSGRETREELSEESEKLLNQVKVDIENAKKAALRSFDQSKDRIIEKLVHEDNSSDQSSTARTEEIADEKRPKRKRPRRTKPKKENDA
jgi:gas vesicle protein